MKNAKMQKFFMIAAVAVLFLSFSIEGASAAENAAKQNIIRVGAYPSAEGGAEIFTGRVRIDNLFPAQSPAKFSGAYVTFEPGARSNWHTHTVGQTLVVTSGIGLTQEWGGPIVEVHPGDVIQCPVGVKHWHGAAPKTSMTHLSVCEERDGKVVNWMEKVTDEQYLQYKGKN